MNNWGSRDGTYWASYITSLGPIGPNIQAKKIPIGSVLDHLSSLTNMVEFEVRAHLMALFGDKAGLRFRLPEEDFDQQFGPHKPDSDMLLSGCQSNETSEDIPHIGPNHKAHGAFSYSVQSVIEAEKGPLSNKEVVLLSRKTLEDQEIERQHPCLYCSDENANAPFVLWETSTK